MRSRRIEITAQHTQLNHTYYTQCVCACLAPLRIWIKFRRITASFRCVSIRLNFVPFSQNTYSPFVWMRSHSPENPACVDTSSFSHQQMELAAIKEFSVSSSIEWNNIGIHKSNNLMFSASCYFNLKWMKTVESKSITANHIPKLLFQTVEDWNCSYFQCVFIDIEIQQIHSTLRSVACSKFGLNDRMNTNTHTYTWKPYPTGRLFPTILTRHVL